ncbi:hypothetical protein AB7M63_002759 [Bradyrhizobium japonicum]
MGDGANGIAGGTTDTSGFVDHLRAIHLTLCIVCVVGIIAISSQAPSAATRAYERANLLLQLKNRWDNGKWLETYVASHEMAGRAIKLDISGPAKETVQLVPAPASSARSRQRFEWFTLGASEGQGFAAVRIRFDDSTRITTLADAESLWNLLRRVQYAITPGVVRRGWRIDFDGKVTELKIENAGQTTVERKNDPPGSKAEQLDFWLRKELLADPTKDQNSNLRAARKLINESRSGCYLMASGFAAPDNPQGKLVMMLPMPIIPALYEVDCKSEKIDLQSLLGQTILPSGFPLGDFQESFPDVSELAKDLKSLSLTELQTFFRSEKDRASDKVEFPGFKLPADSLAYWGSGIIFAMSLYWFSVLRDFRLRVATSDKAWSVPWIGTSREIVSRCLFIVTTILPIAAVGYLLSKGFDRTSTRWAWALAGALAVAVPIVGILHSWWILQHREAGEPKEAMPSPDLMQGG